MMARTPFGKAVAVAAAGLSGFAGIFPVSLAEGQEEELNRETIEAMSRMVDAFVENRWVVGAEFLVMHRGDVLIHRGFGMRDLEDQVPMEVGTLFNLRSMTKPLVGSIAQRLIDAGSMSLDDPVSRYLPSFASGQSARITIEHLLTHTSGLPDGNPAGKPSDYPTLRSIADYWGTHGPTAAEPGTTFHYSDPGADVLGAVLEVVSGLPLDKLAEREVFDPLGMGDSYALIDNATSRDPRFCSVHSLDAEGNWRPIWKPGDGSIAPFTIGSGTTWYATPADYARFLSAWLREGPMETGRWLSEAAIGRALTPGPLMEEYANRFPEAEVHYGQMWQVYVDTGEPDMERVVAFGHSGSDGTYGWVWPDQNLIILYFTQSRGQRTRLLLEERFEDLFRKAAPPVDTRDPD